MDNLNLEKIDQFSSLVDEVKTILSETNFNLALSLIEQKHLIGETIAKNSLYSKFGKGSGDLIKELSVNLNKSTQDLYYCVKFYEKYPNLSTLVETFNPKDKNLHWSDVKALLPKTGEQECNHEEIEFKVVKVITKCSKCNKKLREKAE